MASSISTGSVSANGVYVWCRSEFNFLTQKNWIFGVGTPGCCGWCTCQYCINAAIFLTFPLFWVKIRVKIPFPHWQIRKIARVAGRGGVSLYGVHGSSLGSPAPVPPRCALRPLDTLFRTSILLGEFL